MLTYAVIFACGVGLGWLFSRWLGRRETGAIAFEAPQLIPETGPTRIIPDCAGVWLLRKPRRVEWSTSMGPSYGDTPAPPGWNHWETVEIGVSAYSGHLWRDDNGERVDRMIDVRERWVGKKGGAV